MKIFANLRNTKASILALSVALVFFNINYYIMANLPGYEDLACTIGAGLTPFNIIYSVMMSLLSGILVGNMPQFIKIRSLKSSSPGFTGAALGSFTIFCPLCTLPAISMFGLSISLAFFTTYDIWIKALSLILMLWSLFIINKKLSCNICKN